VPMLLGFAKSGEKISGGMEPGRLVSHFITL
jgi:hypothetical protein